MRHVRVGVVLLATVLWSALAHAQTAIRYGGDANFRPFEWLDEHQKPTGFQVELIREVAQALGRPVEISLGPWPRVREDLLRDRLDAVAMFDLPERRELFDFSKGFAVQYSEIFVRAGSARRETLDSLAGAVVVIQDGALAEDYLTAKGIAATFIRCPDEREAMRVLSRGTGDAAVLTHFGARHAMLQDEIDNVISTSPPVLESSVCFAVRKGNSAMLEALNQGLDRVRDSQHFERLAQRWFAEHDRPTISIRKALRYASWVIGPLLVVTVGVLFWNRALRGRVEARTVELQRELLERRRAEASLAESESRFRLALQGSPISVADQDLELRYTWVHNPPAGLSPIAMIGKTDAEVFRGSAGQRLAELKARVASTGSAGRLDVTHAAGGQTFALDVLAEPRRDASGAVVGVMSAVVDVTPARLAEQRRVELDRRVRQAQKLESLALLAGGIAHDFNNLLAGILGNASLLKSELPPTSDAHVHASTVEQAARRAADLTHQLLAYSGHGSTRISDVNLSALAEETLRVIHASLPAGTRVQTAFAAGLPTVRADATQVGQVVLNIIKNASDSLPAGGGSIRVSTRISRLDEADIETADVGSAAEPGEFACVEVVDDGHGIDAHTRSRLFDPFYSTRGSGRGLGLSVVAGVVRRHSGIIHVTSAPGKGTTFLVCFPLAKSPPADPSLPMQSGLWATGSRLGGLAQTRRVLVAEDNEAVRSVVARSLERAGYEVVAVGDASTALDRMRSAPAPFDCAVLDQRLPDRPGAQLLAMLREKRARLPGVLISGAEDSQAMVLAAADGPSAFLRKPFLPDELVKAVEDILAV